jgi:hypothetical protein
MYYIKQTQKDIDFKVTSMVKLYVELDEDGNSLREIAFDEKNEIVHKFPSDYKNGKYGLFDMVPFSTEGLESDLSKDEFEKVWFNT